MGLINRINSAYDLEKEFENYGRNYYSSEAYEAILDFYDGGGEDVELDVIAICGGFSEYTDPWDLIKSYRLEDWLDYVDLSDFGMTINEWLDNIEDKDEFYENLPEYACYYDNEIEEYVILDYSKFVALDEMDNGYVDYLISSEMKNWDNFKEIVNEYVDKEELFDLIGAELSTNTSVWNFGDSMLIINY